MIITLRDIHFYANIFIFEPEPAHAETDADNRYNYYFLR